MTDTPPTAPDGPAPTAPPVPTPPPSESATPGPTTADIEKLTRALTAERERSKALDKSAREGAAARAELDRIAAANQTETEKAVAAARKEGAAEVMEQANRRLIASEARALAAQARFRDAGDAVRFLDLDQVTVSDGGDVDTAAIGRQLDQLAKDKPYLLADQTPPIPTPVQVGIGVGGGGESPVQPGMDRMRRAYAANKPAART